MVHWFCSLLLLFSLLLLWCCSLHCFTHAALLLLLVSFKQYTQTHVLCLAIVLCLTIVLSVAIVRSLAIVQTDTAIADTNSVSQRQLLSCDTWWASGMQWARHLCQQTVRHQLWH